MYPFLFIHVYLFIRLFTQFQSLIIHVSTFKAGKELPRFSQSVWFEDSLHKTTLPFDIIFRFKVSLAPPSGLMIH